MTERDAATLGKLVAGCRAQMENDLCESFEELGPLLIQAAIECDKTSRDPARSIAAAC